LAKGGSPKTATVRVRVQPRASTNQVVGVRDGVLCVRLTAPPVEGAANQACVEFVAEALGFRRSQVKIASGQKSRDKVLAVESITQAQLDAALSKLASSMAGAPTSTE